MNYTQREYRENEMAVCPVWKDFQPHGVPAVQCNERDLGLLKI